MLNKFLSLFLVLFAITSCKTKKEIVEKPVIVEEVKKEEIPELGSVIILTHEETACFGRCPDYSFTLFEDGRAEYDGRRNVDFIGAYKIKIKDTKVAELLAKAKQVNFDQFQNKYDNEHISDLPFKITGVRNEKGFLKRIENKYGAPEDLINFQSYLHKEINSWDWTPKAGEIKIEKALTFEKTACFGRCPQYKVEIMSNGKATLHGKNFIDFIGNYTYKFDVDQLNIIIKKAKDMGYMGLKSEYDLKNVTDLPSTISGVLIDGKFKSVNCRYECPEKLEEFHKFLHEYLLKMKWELVSNEKN